MLDCPISGGPCARRVGRRSRSWSAATRSVFERVRPALDAIGSSVVHVGPLGHGQIAKLANNLMGAVIIEGIAEGLALAAKAGADVQRVSEAIAGGSGSSWILREWVPETVFAGDYTRRFSLDLMCKDMAHHQRVRRRARRSRARRRGRPRGLRAGGRRGYGNDDFSRAIQLHAAEAGADLGGPER